MTEPTPGNSGDRKWGFGDFVTQRLLWLDERADQRLERFEARFAKCLHDVGEHLDAERQEKLAEVAAIEARTARLADRIARVESRLTR